ncbi:hypothetical protein CYMTET_44351 [Cymbomonas tetramitiformis]|uniref:Uncharacterized protein n=1 Tax=Cymbomonas tetramitiformis TaxID=36881 RepID=A0AAE0F0T3_9CHLO|nr:hypothetical protein CYMTET_44351 [Cymbomonas tetramitiformis]
MEEIYEGEYKPNEQEREEMQTNESLTAPESNVAEQPPKFPSASKTATLTYEFDPISTVRADMLRANNLKNILVKAYLEGFETELRGLRKLNNTITYYMNVNCHDTNCVVHVPDGGEADKKYITNCLRFFLVCLSNRIRVRYMYTVKLNERLQFISKSIQKELVKCKAHTDPQFVLKTWNHNNVTAFCNKIYAPLRTLHQAAYVKLESVELDPADAIKFEVYTFGTHVYAIKQILNAIAECANRVLGE